MRHIDSRYADLVTLLQSVDSELEAVMYSIPETRRARSYLVYATRWLRR